MIGSGLKKLAAEYGMKVDRGVAYGSLQGYAATMCEGAGWKSIVFSTTFSDPVQKTAFMDAVGAVDVQKTYRVTELGIAPDGIQIKFLDNPGTMTKIREFLAWFLPIMQAHGASSWDICPECGYQITQGKWMLFNGSVARYYHDACAEKAIREVSDQNEQRKEEETGSYFKGAIGALIGALLGSVVWALVLLMGYVASLVGLLIGWLADRGYRLMHGKNGKGKIAILIVAVVLGVVFGTVLADALDLARYLGEMENAAFTYSDIPLVIVSLFVGDAEYQRAVLLNIGQGLLFAALGVYWLVIRAGKEVSNDRMVELK